ncbi:hypothetical protein ACWDHH_12125 [Janibacter hoylei]
MAGPHHHALAHHGRSWLHRAPAHLKIVATLLFVVAVVATPREAVWAFGVKRPRFCAAPIRAAALG